MLVRTSRSSFAGTRTLTRASTPAAVNATRLPWSTGSERSGPSWGPFCCRSSERTTRTTWPRCACDCHRISCCVYEYQVAVLLRLSCLVARESSMVVLPPPLLWMPRPSPSPSSGWSYIRGRFTFSLGGFFPVGPPRAYSATLARLILISSPPCAHLSRGARTQWPVLFVISRSNRWFVALILVVCFFSSVRICIPLQQPAFAFL